MTFKKLGGAYKKKSAKGKASKNSKQMNKDKKKVVAYCLRCREKNEMCQPVEVIKGKARMMTGPCVKCKNSMWLILGRVQK